MAPKTEYVRPATRSRQPKTEDASSSAKAPATASSSSSTAPAKRRPGRPAAVASSSSAPPPVKKRTGVKRKVESEDDEAPSPPAKKPAAKKIKPGDTADEKRRKRFRPKPPQSFYDIFERATTQRFFVLSRTRCGTADCPEEVVELTGSTGNIYNVHVGLTPGCDCPHASKGNQCKHWLYVMSRVLRARFDLVYQLALLSTELQEIFASAPAAPSLSGDSSSSTAVDKNRKPIEGDCPICYDELVDSNNKSSASETIVWCKAACGQNMHKQCLQTWSATKRLQKGLATCPMCRQPWEGEEDDAVRKVKRDGPVNEDGYVNVAEQLGISSERDYSSYSSWWGRRRHW